MDAAMPLGDEAVAFAALDAGVSAAYAYPGTPSTEVFECLQSHAAERGVVAHWSANEKTSYEQALGVSMMGRRAFVSMKHVGLNVAADAFINSALVEISGGLVVAVADDPGMHSSQNEQDTRYLAEFARVLCLEPSDHQEAYDFTRRAFDLSEDLHIPVVIRLVTRLCHGRAPVRRGPARAQNPLAKPAEAWEWTLLPGNARRLWRRLLERQPEVAAAARRAVPPRLTPGEGDLGVVTSGIALGYYSEALGQLEAPPPHLHVGSYPPPGDEIRRLAAGVARILVVEEGYPFLERSMRGVLPTACEIQGRDTGHLPPDGELTPDTVKAALGLPEAASPAGPAIGLPSRPPQLCRGCPHADSYAALQEALAAFPSSVVTSDIGCYTLGALPPYRAIESCVCMGASVGMAKGASDAGLRPAVAVIGDSTFLHSGVTALMDAVAADTDMTVLILDNETVAMTGLQPTVLADSRLAPIVLGLGVDPDHVHVIDMQPRATAELAAVLRSELEHPGVSVVIAVRECVEKAKHDRRVEAGRES
jgi:indolepyruvate ferredoxin oxidoreductase alpha subunit